MTLENQTGTSMTSQPEPSAVARPSPVLAPRRARTLYLLSLRDVVGTGSLAALGRYMAINELHPDLVILAGGSNVHSAWSLLERALDDMPRLWMEPQFNDMSCEEQLDVLRNVPADAREVLVIADGTSIARLAGRLARGVGTARTRGVRQSGVIEIPHGALAIITLALARWDGLAPRIGTMKALVRPEDIRLAG